MNKELADLLFPKTKETISDLLKTRWDNDGKPALRFAPSPTGFLHIGHLGLVLTDYMLAKSMGGKCYIRIEDTDQKREVQGAEKLLLDTIKNFGITFDNKPFNQSKRTAIYHVFAKHLVEQGHAYPCFCTEGELNKIREEQHAQKLRTGYHSQFAHCKKLTLKQIEKELTDKKPWVLRMNFNNDTQRVEWKDLVKGQMSLPYEINNAVILKSNGMPPYNLACTVDDLLMGVTHVVRGEEWLASTAEHIQIYNALGLKHPQFAHTPVICVEENGNKRKLSKRRDRESIAQNLLDDGYPKDALVEYLLTINNTDFELWRIANPDKDWREFNFRFEKIGSNSPLFDWDKLNDISKNMLANMSCKKINAEIKKYFESDNAPRKLSAEELEKVYTVLAVDRGSDRPRKDIAKYSEVLTVFDYLFRPVQKTELLKKYTALIKGATNKDKWFAKIKEYCATNNLKVRDYTQSIRVALTGREQTTDLYTISKLMLG